MTYGIETVRQRTARRRLQCFAWLVATVPLGLVWRLAPLHLGQFAFKYGGSALWAIAVYWTVAWLLPTRPVRKLAGVAGLLATAVECFKRVRFTPLDHFRETLAGKLLLGRYFTFGALAAYWLAILVVAWLDAHFGRERSFPRSDPHDRLPLRPSE